MVECITLKTTPSYESDFLFHAKLQTAFQTKWEQNVLCTRVVLCCCFFFDPLRSVGISQILCMVSEI